MKINHIYHSGFSIELKKCVLIFDWYKGDLKDFDENKKIIVFVSHSHSDHYGKCIWGLRQKYNNILYVIDESVPIPDDINRENVLVVKSNEKYYINEMEILTLKSTDEGSAFLVKIEGYNIFHSGDLNVWFWNDEPMKDNLKSLEDCRKQFMKLKNEEIDIAFVPLDPRLEEHGDKGLKLFMEVVGAKKIMPMHYWDEKNRARDYMKSPDLCKYEDVIIFEDSYEL